MLFLFSASLCYTQLWSLQDFLVEAFSEEIAEVAASLGVAEVDGEVEASLEDKEVVGVGVEDGVEEIVGDGVEDKPQAP